MNFEALELGTTNDSLVIKMSCSFNHAILTMDAARSLENIGKVLGKSVRS